MLVLIFVILKTKRSADIFLPRRSSSRYPKVNCDFFLKNSCSSLFTVTESAPSAPRTTLGCPSLPRPLRAVNDPGAYGQALSRLRYHVFALKKAPNLMPPPIRKKSSPGTPTSFQSQTPSAVQQTWHTYESSGQILALVFRHKSFTRFRHKSFTLS